MDILLFSPAKRRRKEFLLKYPCVWGEIKDWGKNIPGFPTHVLSDLLVVLEHMLGMELLKQMHSTRSHSLEEMRSSYWPKKESFQNREKIDM